MSCEIFRNLQITFVSSSSAPAWCLDRQCMVTLHWSNAFTEQSDEWSHVLESVSKVRRLLVCPSSADWIDTITMPSTLGCQHATTPNTGHLAFLVNQGNARRSHTELFTLLSCGTGGDRGVTAPWNLFGQSVHKAAGVSPVSIISPAN